MNTSASRKRNRSDNFDVNDVELLLSLVQEHTELLDSTKLELKKQGWEQISAKFNDNCTGIKRDVNALKLKIKNLKAQSKKTKLEVNDPLSENHSTNGNIAEQDMNEEDEEYDQDNSDVDTKPIINNKVRKRCKKFTKEECELLYKLYEQYCVNLDSSSTPNSVKKRNEAWDNLTTAFNQQQKSGVLRECNELKIKVKNLKASRVKIEPDSDRVNNSQSYIESDTSASKGVVVQEKSMITARSTRSLQTIPAEPKNYSEIAHSTAAVNDLYYEEDFEDDFHQPTKAPASAEDKELEKIRRENILLHNAVLRKKERLLELQISLAERNLRRQL